MDLPETIKMTGGWSRESSVTLTLRMISLQEEQAFMRAFADISDKPDREDQEFQAIVNALAGWSTEPVVDKKGQPVNEAATPSESVKEFFSSRTIHSERLANSFMLSFRNRLQPDVSFL